MGIYQESFRYTGKKCKIHCTNFATEGELKSHTSYNAFPPALIKDSTVKILNQ